MGLEHLRFKTKAEIIITVNGEDLTHDQDEKWKALAILASEVAINQLKDIKIEGYKAKVFVRCHVKGVIK